MKSDIALKPIYYKSKENLNPFDLFVNPTFM